MKLWQAKAPKVTQQRIATNVENKNSCNNLIDFIENYFPSISPMYILDNTNFLSLPRTSLFSNNVS